jgi:hypothetical protein
MFPFLDRICRELQNIHVFLDMDNNLDYRQPKAGYTGKQQLLEETKSWRK